MKLRVKGNSIRLRLTQSEVKQLDEHGWVREQIDFIHLPFIYEIAVSAEGNGVEAHHERGRISVVIPKVIAENWSRSDQVGFESTQSGTSGAIRILIEKDFACLKPREDEDESDAYPNPLESHANC